MGKGISSASSARIFSKRRHWSEPLDLAVIENGGIGGLSFMRRVGKIRSYIGSKAHRIIKNAQITMPPRITAQSIKKSADMRGWRLKQPTRCSFVKRIGNEHKRVFLIFIL